MRWAIYDNATGQTAPQRLDDDPDEFPAIFNSRGEALAELERRDLEDWAHVGEWTDLPEDP